MRSQVNILKQEKKGNVEGKTETIMSKTFPNLMNTKYTNLKFN